MQPQDITNDLILAKKAAIDSGKFLLKEKKKVNQRTNSNSKDIKLKLIILLLCQCRHQLHLQITCYHL